MARDVCTHTFDAVLELDMEYVSGDDELARFRRSSLGPQPCWFFRALDVVLEMVFLGLWLPSVCGCGVYEVVWHGGRVFE